MIKVLPFLALKPSVENAKNVASNSNISEKDMVAELEANPFSYLHIVKPHLHFFEGAQDRTKSYPFAKNYFREMINQKVLEMNNYNAVFIYEQTNKQGHTFSGVIVGINYITYLEGKIKKHENTLAEKEDRLMKHVQTIGAVGEPVLLTHKSNDQVNQWIAKHKEKCTFAFTSADGNTHQVYEISNEQVIAQLQSCYEQINELYIADGHHRVAATTNYCAHLHNSQNKPKKDLMFMAYIIPQEQLIIKSFHRFVSDISNPLVQQLLQGNEHYSVTPVQHAVNPQHKNELGLYINQQWYQISMAKSHHGMLDVAFLDEYIFGQTLQIKDTRTDDRVSYMRGDYPLPKLENRVNSGKAQMAFTLFANTIDEIKTIADNNQTMPPKSTWIEPKLLTGMVIQRI